MTDAQLKALAKENNYEPTYELLSFARLVLINAKIQDLRSVAHNTRLAIQKEREACAVIAETPISGEQDDITMQAKDRVAAAIRARGQA